jgi:hypothetical protein
MQKKYPGIFESHPFVTEALTSSTPRCPSPAPFPMPFKALSRLSTTHPTRCIVLYFRLKLVLLSVKLRLELEFPFSKSEGLMRGVGGTSSSLFIRPPRPTESLTDLGNSDRRGVKAVTTFLADLRSVSLIVHSLFLAMKNRTVLATADGG